MPLPPKLLERGITDMVRISDARMSGTAYGTVVLHVSRIGGGGPSGAGAGRRRDRAGCGGPPVGSCGPGGRVESPAVGLDASAPQATGGYQQLYIEHVLQAHQGADLDFLVGCRGAAVPRESH